MGAAVSDGQSNDEVVDNLIKSGYIKTKKVEQVFRAVDRGDYVLPKQRENAYKNLAWKHGNFHLSAPCIYSEVMEALSLEPGLSFLNLGSGTGYLSTMAGLILNQHGTNHGIELHDDCLEYAYQHLEEFKQKSHALDEFDFCEPVFIQGNCLNIALGRQYDRVYCGATCPESHEGFIKQFVRIGGILVMPVKGQLLRLRKIGENTWLHFAMTPVSFASLIVPTASEQTLLHLPECDPLSLRELCRGKIRSRLRENVWNEHTDLETKKPVLPRTEITPNNYQASSSFVIPISEESDGALRDGNELTRRTWLYLSVDGQPRGFHRTPPVWAFIETNQNQQENWDEEESSNDISNQFIQDFDYSEEDRSATTAPELCLSAEVGGDSMGINMGIETRYFNTSDSDSDAKQEEETLVQRKQVPKREKSDSEIANVSLNNEDGSSSSNANQSDSEIADSADTADAMDVDLSDITLSSPYDSHSDSGDINSSEKVIIAHYVDSNAFSTYMKEKIHQLPLPFSLKLYINYNRKL